MAGPLALRGRAVPRTVFCMIIAGILAGCAGEHTHTHGHNSRPGAVPVHLNELWLRNRPPSTAASTRKPHESGLVFDAPREVLKRVMRASPQRPRVYPTERYYYYRFPDGPRLLSGNIRLVDAERGAISVGYFDAHNPSDVRVGHFDSSQPGIDIKHDAASNTVAVTADGVRRDFVLDQSAYRTPAYPLYRAERFISGILDESGYYFDLIYHQPSRSFYYVLQPDRPLPEPIARGASRKVITWFGAESRFCFVEHAPSGRKILVGVHRREIMNNTWFDGPFDQVPPDLPVRSVLEEAYPYVADAGGIDAHGNFLQLEGQRVAISPYRNYVSGPQLESRLEEVITAQPSPDAWIGATYEYKKDWRPPASPGHTAELSRSWPANHWGRASYLWGEHELDRSALWHPNHLVDPSRQSDPLPGD